MLFHRLSQVIDTFVSLVQSLAKPWPPFVAKSRAGDPGDHVGGAGLSVLFLLLATKGKVEFLK